MRVKTIKHVILLCKIKISQQPFKFLSKSHYQIFSKRLFCLFRLRVMASTYKALMTPTAELESLKTCYRKENKIIKDWKRKQQWIIDEQHDIAEKTKKAYQENKCCILDSRDPMDNPKISSNIFPEINERKGSFVLPKCPYPLTTNSVYGRFPRYEFEHYERFRR